MGNAELIGWKKLLRDYPWFLGKGRYRYKPGRMVTE
jgi:hypothetical protein